MGLTLVRLPRVGSAMRSRVYVSNMYRAFESKQVDHNTSMFERPVAHSSFTQKRDLMRW